MIMKCHSVVLCNGRRFHLLAVIDQFSRACLGIVVVQILTELTQEHGNPNMILSDNGPEFTFKAIVIWAAQNKDQALYYP